MYAAWAPPLAVFLAPNHLAPCWLCLAFDYTCQGIAVGVLCMLAALIYDPCSCCCKAEQTNFKCSAFTRQNHSTI